MNEHIQKAWLDKVLADTQDLDVHDRFRRAHPILIDDVPHVMATDGFRLHMIANPPKVLCRRGRFDKHFSNVRDKIPALSGPYVERDLYVRRGLLCGLRRYCNSYLLNDLAPVMVYAVGDSIEMWAASSKAGPALLYPEFPGEAEEFAEARVQARYLIEALYAFYGRTATFRFTDNSLVITDGTHTALMMALSSHRDFARVSVVIEAAGS
jgi:hypothetical protein